MGEFFSAVERMIHILERKLELLIGCSVLVVNLRRNVSF